MAFRSNGPVMVAFPAFRGVTRRIILIALAAYFGVLLSGIIAPRLLDVLIDHCRLHPDQVMSGQVWQLLTYPFLGETLFGTLFSLLTVWFFGTAIEEERGPRWMGEYFLATTIGGGLVATLIAAATRGHVPGLETAQRASTMWAASLAMLIAFAYLHPEQELNFNLLFRIRAKYLAAIYLLLYLALALSGHDRFGALVVLTNVLCGWLYLRYAPRIGLRGGVSEGLYGLRNAYYRSKRRRSAKQFKVYMGKQGKDVNIDTDGRYIDPTGKPRDPNDKKWMN